MDTSIYYNAHLGEGVGQHCAIPDRRDQSGAKDATARPLAKARDCRSASTSDLDAGNREVRFAPVKDVLSPPQFVRKVPKTDIDPITIRPPRWRGS